MKKRTSGKRVWKLFLRSVIVLEIVSSGMLISIYQVSRSSIIAQEKAREAEHMRSIKVSVQEMLSRIDLDLNQLVNHIEGPYYSQYWTHESLIQGDNAVVQALETFVIMNNNYSSIQLVDEARHELFGVENVNGVLVASSSGNLENQIDNLILDKVLESPAGSLVVTSMGMGGNYGENPNIPIDVHIGKLLDIEVDGEKTVAIVVLGGEEFYKTQIVTREEEMRREILVQENGNVLLGKEIVGDDNLQNVFPDEWNDILNQKEGQIVTTNGMFTFTTVTVTEIMSESSENSVMTVLDNEDNLLIIDFISGEALTGLTSDLINLYAKIALVTTLMSVAVSYGFAKLRIKKEYAEKKVAELNDILKILNKTLRHDILNDLTVIEGYVEVAKDGEGGKQSRETLYSTIGQAVDRSKNLIEKMKDLEMAVASGDELKKVNVCDAAKKASEGFTGELKFKFEGCGLILADSALTSIFVNLYRNSITHGFAKNVSVKTTTERDTVIVSVEDDGKGIPDAVKPKLFAEGAKFGETGNSGLGLYIIKKTIERYGGRVEVTDAKPKGAKFILYFPKEE